MKYIVMLLSTTVTELASDSTSVFTDADVLDNNGFNPWMIIALLEFVIILFFLFRKSATKTSSQMKISVFEEAKISEIDMDNVMMSMHQAKSLYKELSKKYHPDKFVDPALKENAERLFMEMTQHKRNFKKLQELDEEAERILNSPNN